MVKGVIFDMDGVLVDNMEVHGTVFRMFCDKFGAREDAGDPLQYAGMGNNEIMPRVLVPEAIERHGLTWLSDEKERMYREYYGPLMKAAPGLVDFLEGLQDAGIKRAVGSSGQAANVSFVLDGTGIRKYFDAIVNGDMVTRHKPDPDIFLLAAEKMGLAPSECLVIEDAITGIEAAHRAGMKVVALTTSFPRGEIAEKKPDIIVGGFPELSVEKIKSLYE